MDQVRAQQPRRLDQGPHRAVDGGGGRGLGRPQARRHDRRAYLGQHRHRPGDGGRGEGLSPRAGDARQHEHGATPPDAGLRRHVRADTAREGHEGLHRACAGAGGGHAGRLDAAAVRERRQHRGARAHHGRGDRARLSRGPGRADHGRGHRRPPDGLRPGAQGALARAEGVRGRAGRQPGDQRRRAVAAPDPGHRRRFRAEEPAHRPARRRDPGRRRGSARDGATQRARGGPAGGHFQRRHAGGDRAQAARPAGRSARAGLQLRHRRALPVGGRVPAHALTAGTGQRGPLSALLTSLDVMSTIWIMRS